MIKWKDETFQANKAYDQKEVRIFYTKQTSSNSIKVRVLDTGC